MGTTTSQQATDFKNVNLKENKVSEKVELNRKDIKQKKKQKQGMCCKSKAEERPKSIRIEERSLKNHSLWWIYKTLRFFFITIWFYYLPIVVMAYAYLYPLWANLICQKD